MNRALRPLLACLLLLLSGCGGEIVSTGGGTAKCNGELDYREEAIDDLFDTDGDGFVDGNNPECQAAYEPDQLDCNDSNAEIHPDMDEATCNDIDDDCDEDTPDEVDLDGDDYSLCDGDCNDNDANVSPGEGEETCDGLDNDCNPGTLDARDIDADGYTNCDDCVDTDETINPGQPEVPCDGADNDCDPGSIDGADLDLDGSTDCFDCDDDDPAVFPGNPEVCDDGIDQNCDGVDEDCQAGGWSGNWTTNNVFYTCAGGNVDIDFSLIAIQDDTSVANFVFVGSLHPGTMTGAIDASDGLTATATHSASCSQTYTLNGSFLGQNSFSALLAGTFTNCTGCTNQTWTVTGTR